MTTRQDEYATLLDDCEKREERAHNIRSEG